MSSVVKILPHYTYDEYCLWEGRWELIEGIPYAMSPAPVPEHQRVSAAMITRFWQALEQAACGNCTVYNFLDYKIADDTVVQPDLLIVCKQIDKQFLDFAPALVVEILSPSTAIKDRSSKFYLYEAQKIPYYLIADTDKKELEIYRLNTSGKYELEKNDPLKPYTFIFDDDCKAALLISSIWQ